MGKARVRIPPRLIGDTVEKVNALLKSQELTNELGKITVDRVKLEAKRSKPLNDTGEFPSLAEETVMQREYLEHFNITADVYKASRSNLSFSGQLIESIKFRSVSARGATIEIFYDGERAPYKTGPNSVQKMSQYNRTNDALAKTLKKIGFSAFTKDGIESFSPLMTRLRNVVRSFIRRKLR